ncbi:EAL domain-containing protein [Planococcus salinus]|uniref:EAL domain-containing protein n=2 Tax=Planococcus salinus TaxID=1848460 RepID=A0A3M8P6A4_9BACL|nr:EAL domain-containing protein [Planococcus salinus]
MLFCVTGFSCQVAADFLYSYFAYTETYQPGNIVDLFWVLAIFFIGITGFYAIDHKNEAKLGVPNPLGNKDVLIPYTSILLLLFLVIDSYNWDFNILSVGLLVAFFIVLGRQFQILYKNRKLTNQFRHLAYHDPLTGLNNRGSFIEKIETVLENSRDGKVALLLIDLDRFKLVNDTLGHHVGDEVLVKTAERLKKSLTADALLFRIGGDEFTIVLARATEAKCVALAENILTAFQPPMFSEDHEINITPSIGISIFPAHGITSEELMKNADAAMYLSKENGKNSFSFYNAELDKVMMRKLQIENDLKTAISNEQLSLVYQPKVDLQSKKVVGMEALLRWNHPQLGWISPLEFIPIAEETRQIIPIGEWVLNEACRQNKQWQEQGYPPLCVSVNVSVLQFQHGEFLETVQKALQTSQLDAQFLELEITESMMQDIKESRDILDSLMKEGVKTSIDDFGTGYSSLSILPNLPIDTIKIDKSFMDELEKTGQYSIVKTIIDLSQNLNLKVVAEGIETESQRQILRENGCLVGQGYLFYKPVAPNDFESILKEAALKGDQDEIPLLGDFVQQKAILQK